MYTPLAYRNKGWSGEEVVVMAAPFRTPIICPVVIGREHQVEALDDLINQACSSHGQMVLVTGEAGIGKSRLVAETVSRLRSSQSQGGEPAALILQGRCF